MTDTPSKPKLPDLPRLTEMKGAPRGMLLYYVLNSISTKPRHGYEILQDIESKTEGTWKPGVGSVYPILKKLLDRGYIKADDEDSGDNKRVYGITAKGTQMMKEHGSMFTNSSERWMAMRRLFFDMLDPAGLSRMFVEGSRKQFEIAKDVLESRKTEMSRNDMEFMLREYSLNLERQLDWTSNQLKDLSSKPASKHLE